MTRLIDRTTGAIIGALALALIAVLAGIVNAGPLDPPGAPDSTDGVRLPGTPVSSLPFSIEKPGSYYVTRDLTMASSGNGIIIAADDVTIDLNGFTLRGGDTGAAGISNAGVERTNLTIRNGVIRDWTSDGIQLEPARHGLIENVQAFSNTGVGVFVGNEFILRNVEARENTVGGVRLFGNNSLVSESVMSANLGYGIRAQSAFSVIRDNVVADNTTDGILVGAGASVIGNFSQGNGNDGDGAGIHALGSRNRIEGNQVMHNDRGIDVDSVGNMIIGNSAQSNTDNYGAVVAGNTFGPIVTSGNVATNTNPSANYAP